MNENYAKQFEPIDGKWKIYDRLGAGSFGTVFKIERIDSPGEFSALKIISIPPSEDALDAYWDEHPTSSDNDVSTYYHGLVDELKKECNLMSKLKGHSNIVSIEDYDEIPKKNSIGWDILVRMELLTPITRRFREKFPDETDVIKLGIDICKALEICKQNKIIHRDIKPSNIFYSPYGDYKLGDFGVARTFSKSSSTASKRGTPNFMAPEMYKGLKYGADIDIYSLGIVLYKYLNNGNEPFRNENTYTDEEYAFEQRMKGARMPRPANGSKELASVVLKACSYNPKDRFTSPAQMRTALELVLQGKKNVLSLLPEDEPELDDEEASKKGQTIGIFGTRQVKKEDGESKEIQVDDSDSDDDKPNKHKPLFAIVASLVVIIIAAIAGFAITKYKPSVGVNQTTDGISVSDEVDEIESTTEEITTEESTFEETTTEEETTDESTTEETLPVQKKWSAWSDELPDYVNKKDYKVEERTLYKSKKLEKKSSTNKNAYKVSDGWERYDTVEGKGDYGAWSNWSTEKVNETDTIDVESEVRYRYKTKETTTGSSSTMSDWELYNTTYSWSDYGGWSDWSTSYFAGSDSRKVESKKQYRYRDKKTGYTDWVETGWVDSTRSTGDLCQFVSQRTVYPFYYFYCYTCGRNARFPYWNITCEVCKKTKITLESGTVEWFTNPWSSSIAWGKGTGKYYQNINGGIWWNWADGSPKTQYKYKTRETKPYWTEWSSYSDTAYSTSSTREVQTRTVYRYCDRTKIPTYYFYRWSDWSGWSTTPVSENENRKVDKQMFYRSRERVYVKTYYFKKWSNWSDWSTTPVSASEEVKVETKKEYRFKSK